MPLRCLVTRDEPAVPDDSPAGREFQKCLNAALRTARSNLHLAQARQKYFADRDRIPSPFKRGDEVLLDSKIYHFDEPSTHKLNQKRYGPLRVIDADPETVKLRTPLDKDFHCRMHASACKLFNRADEDKQPVLPASQIDSHNWEIKEILGHRWDSDPRRKVFRARFMYPPITCLNWTNGLWAKA